MHRIPRRLMCKRCPATTDLHKPDARWNAVWDKGYLTGFLCPDCQTPEENAEAEINAATMTPVGIDEAGRAWGRRNG